MLKRSILAAVLVVLAAGGAYAQEKDPARTTLEQGAFAEEHERDFEKAAKLYQEAASAAKDEEAKREALKAYERVMARLGRPVAKAAGEEVDEAVENRIYLLVKELSTGDEKERQSAVHSLALFGAAAVPSLVDALAAKPILTTREQRLLKNLLWVPGADHALGDSRWAAIALAAIDAPEAAAALERGLASPDPFVRGAVVGALRVDRHRALLERLARDPREKARWVAVQTLAQSDDPSLVPLMNEWALEPEARWEPMDWLAKNAPRRPLEIAADESLLVGPRAQALSYLAMGGSKVPIRERLEAALRATETTKELKIAQAGLGVLDRLASELRDVDEPARERIETVALAWWGKLSDRWEGTQRSLFQRVGGIRTLEVVVARVVEGQVLPRDVAWAFDARRLAPAEFPRVTALLRKLPAKVGKGERSEPYDPGEMTILVLHQISSKGGVPATDILAGLEGLTGERRGRYLEQLVAERPDSGLAPALRECLTIEERGVRRAALTTMGGTGDPVFLPDVVAYLGEQSNAVAAYSQLAPKDPKRACALLEEALRRLRSPTCTSYVTEIRSTTRISAGSPTASASRSSPCSSSARASRSSSGSGLGPRRFAATSRTSSRAM